MSTVEQAADTRRVLAAYDLGMAAERQLAQRRAELRDKALAAFADTCPPWCVAEHEDGDSEHYGALNWTGPLGLTPNRTDGVTSVGVHHASGNFSLVEADEARAMARALNEAADLAESGV